MMKSLLPLTLAALLAAPAFAAEQKLLPAQSEVVFTSRQMGVPVDGKFRRFDAQVAFDPKKPETGRIGITIDVASVAMGAPEPEAELAKPAWFDSKRFPQASFQSTGIKAVGPGKYEVAGKLMLKGTPRDVVVPVALARKGDTTVASGTFALKRLDFKIGEGEWSDFALVANDVQIKFKLALTGIGPL